MQLIGHPWVPSLRITPPTMMMSNLHCVMMFCLTLLLQNVTEAMNYFSRLAISLRQNLANYIYMYAQA